MTDVAKMFTGDNIWTLLIILLIAYGLFSVSSYLYRKSDPSNVATDNTTTSVAVPMNSIHASSGSSNSAKKVATNNMNNAQNPLNPSDLLPNNTSAAWAANNPNGQSNLASSDMLVVGPVGGIDTIGQAFKNPDLSGRPQPPIPPPAAPGKWNQSTIERDQYAEVAN